MIIKNTMKKTLIVVCLLLGAFAYPDDDIKINGNPLAYYIDNTAVFEENQTDPHTPIAPFEKEQNARLGDWTASEWVLSLNGTWDFYWSDVPQKAPWDFFRVDYDVGAWQQISVPSNWQMQGFGDPKFRNVAQPFPADPPHPPADYNPVGSYRRTFFLSESWEGRRLFLYFEGVKTAAFVWVNGEYVGYNEGGMEPAEFDVTDVVKTGPNVIAVQVLRYADATYLECQDMWRLSGIYRPVYLLAMPKTFIRDYYIATDLDELYRDAGLNIQIDIHNASDLTVQGYAIESKLLDENGNTIFNSTKVISDLHGWESSQIMLTEHVEKPAKWSAEKPNLYTLVLTLKNEEGEVVQIAGQAIGFREVEVRDQALFINGVPVKLNGVNSHVHHPETGRTMDVRTMREDLRLMKQFNINSVRTSHYPQNREYYDLADRLGIYVIDETNDEAHATTWVSERPEYRAMYVDRARKMVYRDRNHPSIIIWSAGNESGTGDNIDALITEGKRIDPSRPAWLYGGNNDYYPGAGPMPYEDIVGPRYPTPFELEVDIAQSDDPRPSFMDEYVAVTGNGGGMFDEFWEVIRTYPRTIGGAVWDWVSPTIHLPWIETPDDSPFGNHGAVMGRHDLVDGVFGKALALSGQDAWIEIYRAPELDLDADALTLSMWIKPQEWNGLESYITKGDWQFGLRQSDRDSLEFYTTTQEKVSLKGPVPSDWVGQWHHLAAVYDGGSMKLFIDSVQLAESSQTGRMINTPFPINIGRNWETDDQDFTGNMCNALVDRVAVFDRVLFPDALFSVGPEEAHLWLDFESVEETDNFYSYGIGGRTYGLIWADRRPQPELYQLKKSGQPVTAKSLDLAEGRIEITNWFHFTNLNELEGSWQVTADGQSVQRGSLGVNLGPLQTAEIQVPFSTITPEPGVRYYVTLSWKLIQETTWAAADHEVAFIQYELPFYVRQVSIRSDEPGEIRVEETDRFVTLSGQDFAYVFDKQVGMLTSIRFQGQEFIQTGPRMSVWRAPLANDLDQWTRGRARVTNAHPALSGFAANGFWAAGLDQLKPYLDRFDVAERGDKVFVTIVTHEIADGHTTAFSNRYEYAVHASGDIILTHTLTPEGLMPHYLPKMGLQMVLSGHLRQWTYLGRGPFETYPDRKTGAKVGLWETTVDEADVPYIIPQDHANRTDVSWTAFMSESGSGLFIQAAEPLNVSARKWDEDNLSRALVIPQLKTFDGVTVNIDPEVSGVGCTAVSILNKHRVFPNEISYKIRIRPFDTNQTDPLILGRMNIN